MAALKFFNPATLLPSPEAAIKPPPRNNTNSFLIASALKEATSLIGKYQDMKSLKQETNNLAEYVDNQSPELAEYLRNKSAGYSLGTDAASERANLIKGITQLHDMELSKQKADQYGNTQKATSLYSAKLNFSQKTAADAQSAYEAFEKEENDREQNANVQMQLEH